MIFIHDHKFVNKKSAYYSTGSLSNQVFERYMKIFGQVKVFAQERTYTSEDEKFINERRKVDNVNFNLMEQTSSPLKILRNFKRLEDEIANEDYIIIRLPSVYGFAAVHYAKKMKKKFLVEVVGCPWDALWNYNLKGKMVAPLFRWLNRKSVKKAPYVLYVTDEFLQNRYPTTGDSIGCSDVELPMTSSSVLDERIEKIKNINFERPIVIGTTAAIDVHYKGQDDVIKAISALKKKGIMFNYKLAGGGSSNYLKSVAYENQVEENVQFVGSLTHKEVFGFLDSIDIYIHPSKQEGMPRALIEAMSRALPSLGSMTGGIPELLGENYIFKSGSIQKIAKSLESFRDKDKLLQSGRDNFAKSKEFDSKKLTHERMNFYNKYKLDVDNNEQVIAETITNIK